MSGLELIFFGFDHVFNVNVDIAVLDVTRQLVQVLTATGARDTEPGVNFKQRAVGRTLDVFAVAVEKFIGHPVQFGTGVGTEIAIDMYLVVMEYRKYTEIGRGLIAPRRTRRKLG